MIPPRPQTRARQCCPAAGWPFEPFARDSEHERMPGARSAGRRVDSVFADDALRSAWRTRWRARLAELGIGHAADRLRSAVNFVSQDDR